MDQVIMPLSCAEADKIKEDIRSFDETVVSPVPGFTAGSPVFKATDPDGGLIGGLTTALDEWGSIELVNLWVDERARGKGVGSALIRAAEDAARDQGRYLSIVSTWSYQARPLYEKNGYTLCSTVTDWPKGYDSYYLTKRLDAPCEAPVRSKPRSAGYEIAPGDKEVAGTVHLKLHEYNFATVPRPRGHQTFANKLDKTDGATLAGCVFDMDGFGICVLEAIWVDEASRRRGAGSYLLAATEREAKESGGVFAVAYVYDWSAGFFLKNGYEVCGAIEDHPKGHRKYVLKKNL